MNLSVSLLLVCLETVNCSITRGTEPPLNWMSSANSRCPLGIQIDIPKFFQHLGSLSPYTTLDYQIDSTCPADWTQVDRFRRQDKRRPKMNPSGWKLIWLDPVPYHLEYGMDKASACSGITSAGRGGIRGVPCRRHSFPRSIAVPRPNHLAETDN